MEEQKENRIVLPYIVFGFFSILLLFYGLAKAWQTGAIVTLLLGIAACIGVHFLKDVQTTTKRMLFSIVVWSNMALYMLQDVNDILVLGMIIAFIVLLSQFNMVSLHYISIAAVIIMFTIHCFDLLTTSRDALLAIPKLMLNYLPIALVEFIEFNQLKERLQREGQLQSTLTELKAAEQGKMDLMANVSHELRTPLNTICGNASTLLKEPLTKKVEEDIHQIHIAGRQLIALVSDILDFTELENDTMDIVNEPYNITSVINDIINMSRTWSDEKNLDMILDVDARIPSSLIGDSQKIYRVIRNLLNNAFKFTSKGGVTLLIRARKEPYGVNLAIEIKDTGIGIREEDLEKLNTVYNQVDTSRSRKEGGVGLGLAISRKMIAKMNGFMHITSVYGEGTTVSVVIPQGCSSYDPVVSVAHSSSIRILYYVNLQKYKNGHIRDDYVDCVQHIADGLQLQNLRCHTIQELQRRIQSGKYNYVFTSIVEYLQHKEYFDSIKAKANIVVVVNSQKDIGQISPGVRIIRKPFHVFGVAAILNDKNLALTEHTISSARKVFYAPSAKILAVDDVTMNLNVLASLLRPYKITIDTAQSGKEALEKISRTHYDLIFLDHMMPEMDGVDTLHNIRRLPNSYSQEIPVVALTANAIGGAREMLMKEGFDDFIAKPIEYSALERILTKFLSHRIVPTEHTVSEVKDTGDVLTKLKALPCLNAEDGLIYCGNELQSYLEILRDFIQSGRKRMKQLEHELQEEDFPAYKITVHSLKGMSATIGGNDVAELSKDLQQACESQDYDAVRQHHPQLIRLLETLLQSLEDILGSEEEKESCARPPEAWADKDEASDPAAAQAGESPSLAHPDTNALFEELGQAIGMFNQMRTLELTEQLEKGNPDNPKFRQLAQQLRSCMERFDFMEAERILTETGGIQE